MAMQRPYISAGRNQLGVLNAHGLQAVRNHQRRDHACVDHANALLP